jgi:hypothetical protein
MTLPPVARNNYCSLNYHANFTAANYGKDPKNRDLNGHVQGELFFDGRCRFRHMRSPHAWQQTIW